MLRMHPRLSIFMPPSLQPAVGTFHGTVSGVNTHSITAELARAGTRPYMLFGLEGGWILDIGGVTSGQDTRHVVLISETNQRFTGHFTQRLQHRDHRYNPDIQNLTLISSDGTSVSLEGSS